MVGGGLVALVITTALVSFVWTPADPTHIVVGDRFLAPGQHGHLLGTDQLGRDTLSMIMVGARNELFVGIIAVAIAMSLGVPLGGLAAIRGGWLEELIMRASDILFAFPSLLLAIMFAAIFGPSTITAMVAIGLAYVPVFARLTRSGTAKVLTEDYILAARACGTGRTVIFMRHVLRNIAAVITVQATVAFALAILAEAALSYLGLATQPPTPSWGRMLSQAQDYLSFAPLLALWPGIAIALTVLGFNLMGDGIRDVLDPRLEVMR
jgi:peptide/nickel transport system permease protein